MDLERVSGIADAVLLEGHVLYPYRVSARKNRFRWAFGVLAPKAWSQRTGVEPWWSETHCLIEPDGGGVRLEGRLRFLHARRRRVEALRQGELSPVESLDVDGRLLVPWDEADVSEVDFAASLGVAGEEQVTGFGVPGRSDVEVIRDSTGATRGRVTRRSCSVRGTIRVRWQPLSTERPLQRLCVRIENLTPWEELEASREDVLPVCCITTHVLLAVGGGRFVSLLDPPGWAAPAVALCSNMHTFPVLAGEPGQRDLVLSSPIVMDDHPRIAPESPGDSCDATELDELLGSSVLPGSRVRS